jgi:hypothetical protein
MNHKLGKRRRRLLERATSSPVVAKPVAAVRYLHGGKAGLKVGAYLLPPAVTGVEQNGVVPDHVRRKDRVYITTDPNTAIVWATGCHASHFYEVEPEGELTDDPDHKGQGISFECKKAKIVSVHPISVETQKKARAALLKGPS